MIRKATINDIDAISRIYGQIHDMDESGEYAVGWKRGVYPTRDLAAGHLDDGDLFVCERDVELRIDTQARNMKARRFYPKFGFKEIGIVKCEFCGCGTVDLVLMEKHLM